MTVAAQNPAVAYTGNGVTTVFAYTFRILDQTYVKVYINGVLQVGGYTVSGVNNPGGGNITFAVAPANGAAVLFQRNTAQDQQVDYTPYDAFPSETHETALDKLTMLVQEGIAGANHAITIPPNETTITQLPSAAVRANSFVAFDGAGNVIIAAGASSVPVSPFMATVLDDPTAAAARATLGVAALAEPAAKGDTIRATGANAWTVRAKPADGSLFVADAAQADGWRATAYPVEDQEDIATAATPAIFASLKRVIRLTGTTNITAFDAGALGSWRLVHVQTTGALLVNGANLINPFAFDIQMMAGDTFIVEALGGGVSKIHNYVRADGQKLLGGRIPFGILFFGALNLQASATNYAGRIGYTSVGAELDAELVIPESCTISNLRLVASAAIAGGTCVATLRKNRADTALTCTLNAGAGTVASDLAHTVDYSEGDLLTLKLTTGAIGAVTDFGFSVSIKKKGLDVGVPMQFFYSPFNRQVAGNLACHAGAGATEVNHSYPLPPCRIEQRAPYMAVAGTTSMPHGWEPRRNEAAPVLTLGIGSYADSLNGATGAVFRAGARGAVVAYAESDLYTLYGQASDDYQYVRGCMAALGATDQQFPHSLLIFKCAQQAQALTRYASGYIGESEGIYQSATETDVQVPMPAACTLRGLRVALSAAPAGGQTFTITVRKNGADTGLTCTVTSAGRIASDLANSAVFAAGDLLTVKVVSSATSGTRSVQISIEANYL